MPSESGSATHKQVARANMHIDLPYILYLNGQSGGVKNVLYYVQHIAKLR